MIRVLFFGRFSDLVDSADGWNLDSESISSVADVVAKIASADPKLHREVTEPQVLVAVNQQIAGQETPLSDGDEVAFLPPVTGG